LAIEIAIRVAVPSNKYVLFTAFSYLGAGATPRAIAAELNADRIAPPRGARWNASTINGNNARGHGMLLNELYVGRIVWNKVRMVKDPTTGKRISRINAKEQHRITEAPQLRVIDDATWNAAQAIKLKRSHLGAPQSRAPRRPLSGLLRCGSCGGGMVSIGNHKRTARLQCFTLDACRHGGMTELEESDLTDGQGRALSAHRTHQSYAGYAKRTEARMLSATRKRHAHRLANQMATSVQNELADAIQNEKSGNARSA
jgi:hypothetical protein